MQAWAKLTKKIMFLQIHSWARACQPRWQGIPCVIIVFNGPWMDSAVLPEFFRAEFLRALVTKPLPPIGDFESSKYEEHRFDTPHGQCCSKQEKVIWVKGNVARTNRSFWLADVSEYSTMQHYQSILQPTGASLATRLNHRYIYFRYTLNKIRKNPVSIQNTHYGVNKI